MSRRTAATFNRMEARSLQTLANAHEAVQSAARAVALVGDALKAAGEAVKACADTEDSRRLPPAIGFEVGQRDDSDDFYEEQSRSRRAAAGMPRCCNGVCDPSIIGCERRTVQPYKESTKK